MFYNRLMGVSESNQGEVITKVKDNLWQSSRGTLYWLVEPELCQSSTGVYYRRTGLNVYGSDSTWFSSLDVVHQTQKPDVGTKKAENVSNVNTGAIGCLTIVAFFVLVVATYLV